MSNSSCLQGESASQEDCKAAVKTSIMHKRLNAGLTTSIIREDSDAGKGKMVELLSLDKTS